MTRRQPTTPSTPGRAAARAVGSSHRMVLAVTVLGLALALFIPRSRAYAANPALSFALVEEKNGRRFNRFADALAAELEAESGGYRDVAARISRLSKKQAKG